MKKILSFLVATVMCLSMFGTVFAAEFNFTDVKTSDWFYNDVKSAVEMGLVNGKSETSYAPNDNLTYAEAIKLAACMNQLYNEGEITITSGNPWYKPYVDYCTKNEIIDKEYNYTDVATRAGYMGIFAKALPDEGLKAINNVPDNSIPDVPSSKAYAAGVYKLYRAGILTGVDDAHNCNPLANIKRSEVAAILTRMMNEDKRVEFSMGKEEQKPEEKEPEEKEPETTEPLAIKTQPGEKTAAPETEVEFTVEVEGGKAPYTYQWRREIGGAKKVATDIPGETNATIKQTTPAAGISTTFWCVITDANGDAVKSENAVLTGKAESTGGVKDKFQQGDSEELKKEDFLMYVEDVYTITGRGVVATGRIVNGTISTGDSLAIVAADGTKKEATVAGIEMFRKMLDEAEKGDNIGLLFNAEIDKTMVARGDSIISADSTYSVTGTLKGTLKLTTKEEGGRATAISEEHSPQFYRSGHDFTGKITGLTDGTINPGETQEDITVTFSSFKGVFYVGQELSVREGGRTIGTFTITSLSSGGRVTRPGTATRPGTVTRPTTGSDTTEEEEESSTTSGGRVSIPTGKNEYME